MRFKKGKRIIIRISDFIDRITDFLVYLPLSNPIEYWRDELRKEAKK